MKLFGDRHDRRPRLEIVPMIDVMLLLLVFYILSTVALGRQQGIPVNLPRAATGTPNAMNNDVMITITRDGVFYLGKTRIREQDLVSSVQALADRTPGGLKALREAGVVINADMSVQHRLVVTTMDSLRTLDITHFRIATDATAGKP
ncbi:MAG: biopolymer transporter ExbD [bacterium]